MSVEAKEIWFNNVVVSNVYNKNGVNVMEFTTAKSGYKVRGITKKDMGVVAGQEVNVLIRNVKTEDNQVSYVNAVKVREAVAA